MKVKFILFFSGIFFSLFLAEVGFRIFDYYWQSLPQNQPDAFLYVWSSNPLQSLPGGGVSGKPDSIFRHQCVFGEETVFDVTLKTNNLGFFDSRFYQLNPESKRRIAVVGDSYTQAIGSTPWITPLAQKIESQHPVQIFNLGILGTGFENFEKLLTYHQPRLQFTDVIVLAIENDFDRQLWYPLSAAGKLWLCKLSHTPEECVQQPTFFRVADAADSPGAPSVTNQVRKPTADSSRFPARRWYTKLLRPVIAHSALFTFINGRRQQYLAFRRSHESDNLPARFPQNFSALQAIVQRYTPDRVTVVRFPSRNEAMNGYYESNSKSMVAPTVHRYVDLWEHCPFTPDWYYEGDHHFTPEGYALLSACFEKYVLSPFLAEDYPE